MHPDGTQVGHFTSGIVQVLKPGGYRKQSMPDGMVIEQWPDGKVKQTNKDGSCIEKHKDGSTIHTSADGSVTETRADGYKKQITDNVTVETFPDGKQVATFKNGTVKTQFPDGHAEQQSPDGTVIRINKDGTREQINADKTKIMFDNEGNKISFHPDGTKIIIQADGTCVQVNKDGKRSIRRSRMRKKPNAGGDAAKAHAKMKAKAKSAVAESRSALPSRSARTSSVRQVRRKTMAPTNNASNDNLSSDEKVVALREQLRKATAELSESRAMCELIKKSQRAAEDEAHKAKAELKKHKNSDSQHDKEAAAAEKALVLSLSRKNASLQEEVINLQRKMALLKHQLQAAADGEAEAATEAGPDNAEDAIKLSLTFTDSAAAREHLEMALGIVQREKFALANPDVRRHATKWPANMDPIGVHSDINRMLWMRIFEYVEVADVVHCMTASSEINELVRDDTSYWKTELNRMTEEFFGEWATTEVNSYLEDETDLQELNNPYLELCTRVAQTAFLGVPADESDEPCSHIIMDLGANQVRVGANTEEFAEPIVVDCPATAGLEDKLQLAVQRLMGSTRYCRELNVLLITGTSLDARANEEETIRIVFDTLKPRALRLCRSGETALMVFAKQTGLVVDAGSDFIHLVPCYQMSFVDYASTYIPLGGNTITQRLSRHMQSLGFALSAAELNKIKESVVMVSPSGNAEDMESIPSKQYTLASGTTVTISGKQRCDAAEILFKPALEGRPIGGLAQAIADCVGRCPIDTRKDLLDNVCLTGGCALIPGLQERLQSELQRLSVTPVNVNIADTSNPALTRNCAYMGAHLMTEIAVDNDNGLDGYTEFELYDSDANTAVRQVLGKD